MARSSIRKRTWRSNSGEQRTTWQADYSDQAGKRHRQSFGTKREADAWLVTTRHEVSQGTHSPKNNSITVVEAGQTWLAQGVTDGLEASTIRQYRQHLGHIVPLLGAHRLAQLTVATIKAFRNDLIASGHSRVMAKKVVSSLGAILTDAQATGRVGQNVVRAEIQQNRTATRRRRMVEKRRERRIEEGVDFPTKDELRRMMAVPGRWHALVVTAILAGLRASELRGLRWPDVNFPTKAIEVRQRADRFNKIGPLKSPAGAREIPMGPYLTNTLREWKLACPKGSLDLVFPNSKGNIETLFAIHYRGLARLEREAGITGIGNGPKYSMHNLRHAAASLWIESEPPKRVQYLMGHSTIALTFDVYGHLWRSEGDEAAAAALEHRLIGNGAQRG
jgi:integrase